MNDTAGQRQYAFQLGRQVQHLLEALLNARLLQGLEEHVDHHGRHLQAPSTVRGTDILVGVQITGQSTLYPLGMATYTL